MKITTNKLEHAFEPVALTITIESLNELRFLYGCFNVTYDLIKKNSCSCPYGSFVFTEDFEKTRMDLFKIINYLCNN
jgi:hypothetical protein